MRYVIITFFRKPGGAIDEQIGFSKKLRQNDLQTCNIILDYAERKVVKCTVDGKVHPTTFEQMHNYYKEVYPQLIAEVEKINVQVK